MTTKHAIEKLFGETDFPAVCQKCGYRAKFIAGAVKHARKDHHLWFHQSRTTREPMMQYKRTIRFK